MQLTQTAQDDDTLMARARADDTAAFALLYDRHAARALSVAQAICGNPSRAENAVQEGFLAIWRGRAGHLREAGSFRAWVVQTVTDKAKALARGEQDALLASLRRLPEEQAEVIVLALYGKLSHAEIASQLDLPADTIKGRMRLGLERLRRESEEAN